MSKKAILVGASGLIGGLLLNILLEQVNYSEVLVLSRKKLRMRHTKLKQVLVNFDELSNYADEITGDVIFCCLGTTRKKTPNLTEYRKIDHDYPLHLAQIGIKNKIGQFHLVSSMGADASSSNFYTKMKGEIEDDIKKQGIDSLHIYRPSFLVGNRKEDRPMESVLKILAKIIDPLLIGGLKKYRSINAATVAMAMFKQSLKKQDGLFIYPSDQIKHLS